MVSIGLWVYYRFTRRGGRRGQLAWDKIKRESHRGLPESIGTTSLSRYVLISWDQAKRLAILLTQYVHHTYMKPLTLSMLHMTIRRLLTMLPLEWGDVRYLARSDEPAGSFSDPSRLDIRKRPRRLVGPWKFQGETSTFSGPSERKSCRQQWT